MTQYAHRNFAIDALGVSAKIYDEMNEEHAARNASICGARQEYLDALLAAAPDLDKKAAALDALISL